MLVGAASSTNYATLFMPATIAECGPSTFFALESVDAMLACTSTTTISAGGFAPVMRADDAPCTLVASYCTSAMRATLHCVYGLWMVWVASVLGDC